jgi:hypothetical protein
MPNINNDILTTIGTGLASFLAGGGLLKTLAAYYKNDSENAKSISDLSFKVRKGLQKDLEIERKSNEEKDSKILELSVDKAKLEEQLKGIKDKLKEANEKSN